MGWKDEQVIELDSLYQGLFDWLCKQHDSISGGFYYARSSIADPNLTPDIESTAQAINILRRHQLLETLPMEIKKGLIRFFQLKQDPRTGYFYDSNPYMKMDEVMVHRALNYASNSLKRIGSKPLYPMPVDLNVAPSYTKSLASYKRKWESIDLSNSWRGCDILASSTVYMGQLEPSKQEAYTKEMAAFLADLQDEETGLWGEGSYYVRISGTFKLHTFYRKFQIPMPNQDKIYQSILYSLRNEKALDMCYVRNPIDLLSYLDIPIDESELREIMTITIQNLRRLKREDGAFSREVDHSPKAPNVAQVKGLGDYPDMPTPVILSHGLYEGDMNATTQATLIRNQLHRFLNKEPRPLVDRVSFYELLKQQI
ncbi:hypothetical protein [Gracilibacillus sp. YIM 98692]|uniref:hypothetical protein n=1 Tax=Gracilibacillus sp. YIM 98692 TaxID=2663532 RepID=UPI0013D4F2B6|nr:hypothetical protein [Gracilibacillus sp. YIM 98692]